MLIPRSSANLAVMKDPQFPKSIALEGSSMGSDKEPAGHIGPAYLLSSVAKGEVLSVSQPLGK